MREWPEDIRYLSVILTISNAVSPNLWSSDTCGLSAADAYPLVVGFIVPPLFKGTVLDANDGFKINGFGKRCKI